jgi:hypothetical protein
MWYSVYTQICRQACRQISQKTCLLLGSFLIANTAWSWGPLGHQAICDAAWRSSSSATKKAISSAAKRLGYSTFASGCLWADHIRSKKKYNYIKPLHYMNVPKGQYKLGKNPCRDSHLNKPRCVLSAISFYAKRWRNEKLSRGERDEALLLMAHFIGDIHQPLHVGFSDDRGGTRKQITFDGRSLSLHSFWDSKVLSCASRQSWRKLGQQLHASHAGYYNGTYKRSIQTSNVLSQEPRVWAQESYDLTLQIYQAIKQQRPSNYCSAFHAPAIKRLELASLRLAGALKSR